MKCPLSMKKKSLKEEIHEGTFYVTYYSDNEIYYFQVQLETQPAITCSKLTIETLEQGVKYVQS